jgi:protease YdgD
MAMFGARAQRWLLLAALIVAWPASAETQAIGVDPHRESIDPSQQRWSAIGKLYNETGASCSGVVIARDKVLTAAHCVFNPRTRRFIAAEALHFLVGYRVGKYSAHARVAIYQIGANFDPQRYSETSDDDWAVLTLTERLPEEIAPMKFRADLEPAGTKVVMVGYPQDRAHAPTADSDCELRQSIAAGRLILHTCRGIGGYSGAPILVRTAADELQIAGIQIARIENGEAPFMLAVPAPSIARADLGALKGRGESEQNRAAATTLTTAASKSLDDARPLSAQPADDQATAALLAAIAAI